MRQRQLPIAYIALILTPVGVIAQPKNNLYIQHNLVADQSGKADVTDPNLVNPWGISYGASSPFWISDNGVGKTTLYNGAGTITALVVGIPGAGGSTQSSPTGQVNNTNTSAFLLANGKSASFIFVTEDGTLSAWNTGATAQLMADNSGKGAVYKGLALASPPPGPLLYAANFSAGTIDVFDAKFASTTVAGGFKDAAIPAGFAPFNITLLSGSLYVTYAKQDSAKHDDISGAGNGFVDVFDLAGNLQKHLISNGPLNSPWGLALAPSTFGAFGGALLVGNFGDGWINAFDPAAGNQLGTLKDQNGSPIAIDGLWALIFGNGKNGGDKNTLYFTAGPDDEQHGLFGSLAPPATVISILNGASNASGPVSPGEIVVITGVSVGPSPLASAAAPTNGVMGTSVSGTSVTFNGSAAPVLYASASATAVIVPYEISGSQTANVVVTYKNQISAAFQAQVASTAPGLFTLDSSGSGAAVALNSDLTVNSAANAAARGSVVLLFATGEGILDPPGADGGITGEILRTPLAPVTLTIGNVPAQVAYAGTSPGDVQGLLQIEAIVPAGAPTGAQPVVVSINGVNSQSGVTLNVK